MGSAQRSPFPYLPSLRRLMRRASPSASEQSVPAAGRLFPGAMIWQLSGRSSEQTELASARPSAGQHGTTRVFVSLTRGKPGCRLYAWCMAQVQPDKATERLRKVRAVSPTCRSPYTARVDTSRRERTRIGLLHDVFARLLTSLLVLCRPDRPRTSRGSRVRLTRPEFSEPHRRLPPAAARGYSSGTS